MEPLSDDQIEIIRKQFGKVAVVDWSGHQLVFRRPTRVEVRDYRRKQDSPAEKPDAIDQLLQQILVAYDGLTDVPRIAAYTGGFLEEFPAFADTMHAKAAVSCLMGLVEEEDEAQLGKGVSVRTSSRASTRPA